MQYLNNDLNILFLQYIVCNHDVVKQDAEPDIRLTSSIP